MKKVFIGLALLALLTGCTQHTKFGDCVGVLDEKQKDMKYELSVWNGFLAFLFSGTLIVPGYVLLKGIQCPVGPK